MAESQIYPKPPGTFADGLRAILNTSKEESDQQLQEFRKNLPKRKSKHKEKPEEKSRPAE